MKHLNYKRWGKDILRCSAKKGFVINMHTGENK